MDADEYDIMSRMERDHWWFHAKRNYVRTIMEGFRDGLPVNARILDVGCGTGGMIPLMSGFGTVLGMDRFNPALEHARKNIPAGSGMVQADANAIPFRPQSFDGITLFDVLYHRFIRDDRGTIREVHSLLKPGGFLLLTDCAFEFLRSTHDEAVMARHRYNIPELVRKLEAEGFRIQKKSYLFFSIFPLVCAVRLFKRFFGGDEKRHSDLALPVPLANNILKKICRIEALWIRNHKFPFGSSLVILAKKI